MPDDANSAPIEGAPLIGAAGRIPHKRRAVPVLAVWLRDLIISLAISSFIIVFLYTPVKVEGTSMMPSLDDQEHIFVNKFVYQARADRPRRYHRLPLSARPVEELHQARNRSRRRPRPHRRWPRLSQRQTVDEDYVPRGYEDDRSYPELVVPADSYFVLGDHRNLSNDSRDFGPVESSFIFGKAVFGYWPMEKIGRVK